MSLAKKPNPVKLKIMEASKVQNSNQLMLDLHMSAVQTLEECDHPIPENALNDEPGCLLNYEAIAHFRVASCLSFIASPGARPFKWK